MTFADESFLDAYLDGELDPAQRLAIEDALLSQPHLALRLRERAQVRQWVGDLPRPTAPRDHSGPILARIVASPPGWSRRLGWSRALGTRPGRLGAGLAAAGVLIATALAWPVGPKPDPTPRTPSPREVVSVAPPGPVEAARPVEPEPERPLDPPLPPPMAHESADRPALVAIDEEAERRQAADRQRLESLLARPDVRRLFVLVDQFDPPTLDLLDETIRQTSRRDPEYGRLSLAEGIVVDPDHPGEAIVLALALDPLEWTRLRSNLGHAFRRTRAEDRVSGATLTGLLGDVGQLTFQGEQPPAGRVREIEGSILAKRGEEPDPALRGPGRAPSKPATSSRRTASPRPRRELTGLVWVTHPPRGRR